MKKEDQECRTNLTSLPPAVKLLLQASLQWKHNKDVVSALLSLSCSRKLLVEPLVVVSGHTERFLHMSIPSNVNKPQRSRLSSPACCISHSLSQSHGKTRCAIYGFTCARHIGGRITHYTSTYHNKGPCPAHEKQQQNDLQLRRISLYEPRYINMK